MRHPNPLRVHLRGASSEFWLLKTIRPARETPAGLVKTPYDKKTKDFSSLPPLSPVQIRLLLVELEDLLRNLDRLFLLA
jgi:hypothetical protein